jgi:hypothetical protein
MNKKDLSTFRQQFKLDNYSLKIKNLYTAYIKKDNQSILYAELASFESMSEPAQEIHLGNFKKLLTGGLNTKIFELFFNDSTPENEGQTLCRRLLITEQTDFVECCNAYIERLAAHYNYDSDIVISFASGKYNKPAGKKSRKGEEDSLDGFDDTSFGFKFVLCSVNKADDSKRGIYYNAASDRFELSSSLNKEVNFSAPIDGFMYPAIGDFGSDVNKILYYTAKANVRNEDLLENVLKCRLDLTAKQEQEKFEGLLGLVSGGKIKPEILKNISSAITEKLEAYKDDDEIVTLDASEIRVIFEESGIQDLSGFEDAFIQAAEKGYEFKAASLVGSNTRSVRISTGVSDINVDLEDLVSIRQVINSRGRKCLEIELSDDAEINGIVLETESA